MKINKINHINKNKLRFLQLTLTCILILISFVLTVSFISCDTTKKGTGTGNENNKDSSQNENYIEAEVVERDIASKINLVGKVVSRNEKSLSFDLEGKITGIAGLNTVIKKGELLVSIGNELLKKEIDDLKSDIKRKKEYIDHLLKLKNITYVGIEIKKQIAEEEYNNTQGEDLDYMYFKQKLLQLEEEKEQTDYNLLEAENDLNDLEKSLSGKKSQLENVEIYSPFEALIISKAAEVGELVNKNSSVLKIANLNEIILKVDIPEIDRMKIKEEMPAGISFDVYSGKKLEGSVKEISKISKTTDAGTFYEAIIEFKNPSELAEENIDIAGLYGLNANIEIVTEAKENITAVPNDYIFKENGKKFVYKKNADGIEKIEIETGVSDLSFTEIITNSYLKVGDIIIKN
ncbi:MAG: efflux RND transporter periplasmic adaptor subunit [Actinobacteria bacterium]|nr:efflux RND transporter periplasmic adaptor subunit [Actinomycetota bacterium]